MHLPIQDVCTERSRLSRSWIRQRTTEQFQKVLREIIRLMRYGESCWMWHVHHTDCHNFRIMPGSCCGIRWTNIISTLMIMITVIQRLQAMRHMPDSIGWRVMNFRHWHLKWSTRESRPILWMRIIIWIMQIIRAIRPTRRKSGRNCSRHVQVSGFIWWLRSLFRDIHFYIISMQMKIRMALTGCREESAAQVPM